MRLRDRLKNRVGPLLLGVVRSMEPLLPVWVLYVLCYPYACLRAFLAPRPATLSWPGYLFPGMAHPTNPWDSTGFHMNGIILCLPDRLRSSRWRKRCQIIGWERLLKARQEGRPVILAFGHFGPFTLTGNWLRAHGVPVTALSLRTTQSCSRIQRCQDRHLLFPGIPRLLYPDQLREFVKFLSCGGTCLVAIDYLTGRLIDVPIKEGGMVRMATGALRLAAQYRAELIPCSITDMGRWRFRIELGQPVPEQYLTGVPDLLAAGKHLIAELFPRWHRHPGQWCAELAESFQPVPAATR